MQGYYGSADRLQCPSPPHDPAAAFQWVHGLDEGTLYIAMLPDPRKSHASEEPTAVVLTKAMLDMCCPESGIPGSGSMRAGYAAWDEHGMLAHTSGLLPGRRLVLVTFYQFCKYGEAWHPLLQFGIDVSANNKRHTKCLGQLGWGPDAVLDDRPTLALNQKCLVSPHERWAPRLYGLCCVGVHASKIMHSRVHDLHVQSSKHMQAAHASCLHRTAAP